MNNDERRDFYKSLRERIHQLRMSHLFEEPCPLYEHDDKILEILNDEMQHSHELLKAMEMIK